jgi:lactam utilization protein B
MAVGLPVTKSEIDSRAGDLARSFQRLGGDVATLKGYLDATPDGDLIALGYTAGDVPILKSAMSDLHQLLVKIGTGKEALPELKDFTQFARQLWGVGAF